MKDAKAHDQAAGQRGKKTGGNVGKGLAGKGAAGKGAARARRRSAARLGVVQALYQMDIGGTDLPSTMAQFEADRLGAMIDDMQLHDADEAFFRDLLAGVVSDQRRIDRGVDAILKDGWPLTRIDSILRAIFRAGAYEIFNRDDVPARVVINEYIEIAKAFFDKDEVAVVNGLLDRLARQARSQEFATAPSADDE